MLPNLVGQPLHNHQERGAAWSTSLASFMELPVVVYDNYIIIHPIFQCYNIEKLGGAWGRDEAMYL